MTKLSEAATRALVNTAPRVGERVNTGPMGDVPTAVELEDAGYMTRNGNLTRSGQIQRQRILDAMLDAAF